MDEFYLLALASIPGMGPVLFKKILLLASSLEQLKGIDLIKLTNDKEVLSAINKLILILFNDLTFFS